MSAAHPDHPDLAVYYVRRAARARFRRETT
jgi:hypothetical protein